MARCTYILYYLRMDQFHSDCSFVDDFSQNHFNMKLHYGFLFFDYLFKFILQLTLKKMVDFATYPSDACNHIIDELKDIFPQLHGVGNVLETSLNMSNPMAHCPLDLFNLATIDSGVEKLMFASGYTSPKGGSYVEKVDQERLALLDVIGVKGQSLLQLFNKSWQSSYEDLFTAFKKIKSHQTAKSPTDFTSRHFTEDIPFGILPIQKLARKHHIETPYIDAMLAIYHLVLGDAFGVGEPDLSSVDLKKHLG